MKHAPFPLSGGSYRLVDGQLVRDDADLLPSGDGAQTADEGTPSQAAAPAAEQPNPAARGRRKYRED